MPPPAPDQHACRQWSALRVQRGIHMAPLPWFAIDPPAGSQQHSAEGWAPAQEVGLDSKAAGQQLQHASAPHPPPPSKGAAAVLSDRQLRGAHPQAFLMPFGFVPCKAVVRALRPVRIWTSGGSWGDGVKPA